jgi:hypothetical protein
LDTIFPDDQDRNNNKFYVFSELDRQSLLKLENELIPTELLRELWNIVPNRTLPLSQDGANNVVIDKNMTFGQLIQGLSNLAQYNAENRLNMNHHSVLQSKYKKLMNVLRSDLPEVSLKSTPTIPSAKGGG